MTVLPYDVAVELGRPTSPLEASDAERWQRWIDQARLLIQWRLGDLALLDQEALDYVTLQAVVAHARKPDDATQVTVSVDDASTSRTYSSGHGRVTIEDQWWALLDPDFGTGGDAFTVKPYSTPDTPVPVLSGWDVPS